MKDAATSLDRLHGLEPPPEISWWPLAPGWYAVGAMGVMALLFFCFQAWRAWKRNAYRRAAIRELGAAATATEIAEILRRTVLAVVPRSFVSSKTGGSWADWLADGVPDPMPEDVRRQLTTGLYDPAEAGANFESLRRFAEVWVRRHSAEEILSKTNSTR